MRMLEKDDSNEDVAVTRQDQERINSFSNYNSRYDEIEERLESLRKEVEDIDELEPELELMDDDEFVMYKLDTSFLRLPAPEVLQLLQSTMDKLKGEMRQLEGEKDECDQQMKQLKQVLYEKFGNSINLERD